MVCSCCVCLCVFFVLRVCVDFEEPSHSRRIDILVCTYVSASDSDSSGILAHKRPPIPKLRSTLISQATKTGTQALTHISDLQKAYICLRCSTCTWYRMRPNWRSWQVSRWCWLFSFIYVVASVMRGGLVLRWFV